MCNNCSLFSFHHPQDPASVGMLYSLLKERGFFILLLHQSVGSPACIYVHYSHNILLMVMFLFQIGCILHFEVVWGHMYIIYTKEMGLKFCETKFKCYYHYQEPLNAFRFKKNMLESISKTFQIALKMYPSLTENLNLKVILLSKFRVYTIL